MSHEQFNNEPVTADHGEMDLWIDELLLSANRETTAPPALRRDVRRLLSRKRHTHLWLSGAAAAAAILAAIQFWPHEKPIGGDRQVVSVQEAPVIQAPTAKFVGAGDMIVVPVESQYPNVTIVQVYPTTSAQHRWRRENLLRITKTSSNGG